MYKVGIPRSLAYFFYLPLWKTFITELGHEVVNPRPARLFWIEGSKRQLMTLAYQSNCITDMLLTWHSDVICYFAPVWSVCNTRRLWH